MKNVTLELLQQVSEVKELRSLEEAKGYLKEGWILLNEASAPKSGVYSIGRIQSDADQQRN
ncbi:hypothetical protein D3C77_679920 [compost metagenome]